MDSQWDVLILGAGASGLLCAAEAAGRGRSVLVLDHGRVPGAKLRVTGGGACNVTNREVTAADYRSANPHFVKSALARFTPHDLLERLRDLGITTEERDRGKLFCVQGATALAEALACDAASRGAELRLGVEVGEVAVEGDTFRVAAGGESLRARAVVLALGGLAWPQVGASDLGYRLAKRFGLKLVDTRPGLTPLTAGGPFKGLCRDLAGIALPVRIRIPGGPEPVEQDLLFTHQGISGPAVLEASLAWQPGAPLAVDFLPGLDAAEALASFPRMELKNGLARLLPKRLAAGLCELEGWTGPVSGLSPKRLAQIAEYLHAYPLTPAGLAGYAKAEVTSGGVDTARISSKTMQADGVPGLYLTGELLDVTGRLGGYNLHWAWASGYAAGTFC